MIGSPPASHEARLRALDKSALLDAPPMAAYDRVTALVRRLLGVPVALVSLVDRDRQFFLSQSGLSEPWAEARQTPLSHSFCQHVVAAEAPIRVENAPLDPAFCDNLAIRDLNVVGYLGAPIRAPGGEVLGSLCAITPDPRAWTDADVATLEALAAIVESEVALTEALAAASAEAADRRAAGDELQVALDAAHLGRWEADLATGLVTQDAQARAVHGLPPGDEPAPYARVVAALHPDDRPAAEAAYRDVVAAGVGGRFDREYRTVDADGHVRWVRAVGQAREGPDGPRLAGVTWEVTDEREAEGALRESERHKALLLALLQGHRQTSDPRAMMAAAAEALGRHLGAHRVGFFRLADDDTRDFDSGPSWTDGTLAPLGGLSPASGLGEAYLARVRAGDTLGIPDTEASPLTAGSALLDIGTRALIGAPIIRAGRWYGSLYVHHAAPRAWTPAEVALVREVADQVWDAVERAEAEAAVRNSEARLGFALDVAGLGQWELNLDTDATFRSLRHDEIFGYPEGLESWTYEQFLGHVLDEDRAAVDAAFAEAAARGTDWSFECRIRRADGALRWIEGRGRMGFQAGTDHRLMVGTVADVTPRVEAAAAVRNSEARFRLLADTATDVIVTIDEGGTIQYVNAAVEAVFGYAPEGLVGAPFAQLIPDALRARHTAGMARYLATGERRLDWSGVEVPGLRADGTEVPLSISFGDYETPTGRFFTGIIRDESARRAAEAALRASEERFRGTFENAAVGIAHVGLDGRWLRVNRRLSEIVGYDREAFLGLTFQDLTHPDDLGADLEQFARLLAGEITTYSMEKRYLRHDGGVIWINLTVAPNRRDGPPDYMISVVEDISGRKAAEAALRALNDELESRVAARTAELERSNAELDQFAYVASHDLKAPIRAIDSLAAWIAEDVGDGLPEPSARHLRLLRSRAARMEGLLDSLLTYSRVGREAAAPEPVDTAALVGDAVATVAPPEGFDVRLEGDFPVVVTARAPLELVVRNLVGNAIKHHDRVDGRVTVSAEAADGWAHFAVADDGPGIEPAYQERIFGLFQTLLPRDAVEGSGMGLSIVKKAVESRGGRVEVASAGRGTTFRFCWPLRPGVPPLPETP